MTNFGSIKGLIAAGQSFRDQPDQYSELITELADELEKAVRDNHERELHHFETEQEVARLRIVIQNAYNAWHMESRQAAIDILLAEVGSDPTEAAP